MRQKLWKGLTVCVAMTLVVAGCSGNEDGDTDEDASMPSIPSSIPPECEGVELQREVPDGEAPPSDVEDETPIPQQCLDAVYKALIQESGSESLQRVDADLQLSLGYGACSYAQAQRESERPGGGIAQFIELNLPAWQANLASFASDLTDEEVSSIMTGEVIEEILQTAAVLCPEDMQYLNEITDDQGPLQIKLVVINSGDSEVTYTIANGDEVTETVSKTWEFTIALDPVSSYGFRAVSKGDTEVTCQIWVGDSVIVEQAAESEEIAACTASESEIRAAA